MLRDNASQYTFGRSRSTIWPQGNGRMRVTGLSHSYLLKLFTRSIEPRRDGRVVEGTCLESRHTFTGIGGSNPPLSARKLRVSIPRCVHSYATPKDFSRPSLPRRCEREN